MGNLKALCWAAVLVCGCAGPWAAIDRLEDRRDFDVAALTGFLRDPQPQVRARALLALGRLQDARSTPLVVEALGDPQAAVRARAAFAAGLLGLSWQPLEASQRDALTLAVVTALESEADAAVRARLLRALGDLSGARALAALVARGREPGAALALGVAVRRGATPPAGALALFSQLTSAVQPDEVRETGAYGLAVLKAEPAARAPLTDLLRDRSALVRALAAKGLGAHLPDDGAAVLEGALDDSDWRVAAEAARALAKISARCAAPLCRADAVLAQGLVSRVATLSAAVEGERASGVRGSQAADGASSARGASPAANARGDGAAPAAAAPSGPRAPDGPSVAAASSGRDPAAQVLLALAQEGLPAHGAPVLEALRSALAPRLREGSMFANLDCRLAAAQVGLVQSLAPVRRCGGGQIAEGLRLAWGLRALAHAPPAAREAAVAEVAPFLGARDGRLVPAALEALAALGGEAARAAVRPLLDAKDPIVAAAAAAAAVALVDRRALPAVERLLAQGKDNLDVAAGLADTAAGLKAWDGDALAPGPVARQAAQWLTPWLGAQHAAVRHTAAQAIAQLTGVVTRAQELPLIAAAPAQRAVREGATLVLTTEAGRIRLALEAQQAPRTAAWFADLARRGYFDGLTFHRVVPDFVVQGGDPRGDGEGGPGAALRCEINDARYATGALGVALSGKDTGGSQFFITHAPQPHLDGRYTVFGHLLEGQAVADGLLEGDLLLSAEVEGD